jgi:hypothetical protein
MRASKLQELPSQRMERTAPCNSQSCCSCPRPGIKFFKHCRCNYSVSVRLAWRSSSSSLSKSRRAEPSRCSSRRWLPSLSQRFPTLTLRVMFPNAGAEPPAELGTRRLAAFGAIFNQADQREVIAAAIADTSSLKRGRSKFCGSSWPSLKYQSRTAW